MAAIIIAMIRVSIGFSIASTTMSTFFARISRLSTNRLRCLNTDHTRLLAARDELNKPQLSSRARAEREAELTQVNGKLYTVAKAEFDKSCPAVATAPTASVVR